MNAPALLTTFTDMTRTLLTMSETRPADIFICGKRYGEHVEKPIRVLYRGEVYFNVNASELADLQRGVDPVDLELEPEDA